MKTEIEKAIRETLVIENKQSIGIAVDKIKAIKIAKEECKWVSVEENIRLLFLFCEPNGYVVNGFQVAKTINTLKILLSHNPPQTK